MVLETTLNGLFPCMKVKVERAGEFMFPSKHAGRKGWTLAV
jgi:hypothetical protein